MNHRKPIQAEKQPAEHESSGQWAPRDQDGGPQDGDAKGVVEERRPTASMGG